MIWRKASEGFPVSGEPESLTWQIGLPINITTRHRNSKRGLSIIKVDGPLCWDNAGTCHLLSQVEWLDESEGEDLIDSYDRLKAACDSDQELIRSLKEDILSLSKKYENIKRVFERMMNQYSEDKQKDYHDSLSNYWMKEAGFLAPEKGEEG